MPEAALASDAAPSPLRRNEPGRARGGRIVELDGIRGIAILFVLLKHGTINATDLSQAAHRNLSFPMHALRWLFDTGWLGVDLFFILSGYLITGILLDSTERPHYYRNFIVRRALRILPLYYGFLLACFLWARGVPHPHLLWFATYVGNVRVFIDNAWPPIAVLAPLWSLQVEEQFYLTFPWVVKETSRRTLTRILIGSIAGALVFRIALQAYLPNNGYGTYVLMPARMDSLALGGLIAIGSRQSAAILQSRWLGWVAAICALAFLIVWKTPNVFLQQTIGFSLIDIALACVLILLITGRWPLLTRICRSRALAGLGVVSYGLYLLQLPAFELVNRFAAGLIRWPAGDLLEMLIAFAVGTGFACLSWKFFESPILKLKDYFAAPRALPKSWRAAQ